MTNNTKTEPTEQAFGTWHSELSAAKVIEKAIGFGSIEVDDNEIYYLEARPEEKGRATYIRLSDGKELLPSPYYARTTVHEYGGDSGIIDAGIVYFVNFKDQNLYKVLPNQEPKILTNAPNKRFGDFCVSPCKTYLYCVMEDHTDPKNVQNSIVRIHTETGDIENMATGHDFFGAPRVSPDGKQLAYYYWDFPNMPWDSTYLSVLDLSSNKTETIAGGPEEAAVEPRWDNQNTLHYVSDKTGYWNIYSTKQTEPLIKKEADFTYPPWVLGIQYYGFIEINKTPFLACVYCKEGTSALGLLNLQNQQFKTLDLPFTAYTCFAIAKDRIMAVAWSPSQPNALVSIDPVKQNYEIIKKSAENSLTESEISLPQTITFPTANNKTAYGFYYPPKNPRYKGPENSAPPLILFTHGGPTAHVTPTFSKGIQYWTSRGFAVFNINYGGSTGNGREYRERLKGNWGTVDVEDCCNAAKYLAQQGLCDPQRMAIRGGSAGGYTTLAALTFTDTFQAGTSLFGVSDLELLVEDTHKFESRYLDLLVGPYPQEVKKYHQYSPLYHTDKLKYPILLLQGDEDKIVPPEQSEKMYKALMDKGIPTAYILFEGEQHGFRQKENIIRAYEAELAFYAIVFKLQRDDIAEWFQIENASSHR